MKRFLQILKDNAKPVILAILASLATYFASGCSSFTPSDKTQTMGVYALGLPAIAIITQTEQRSENAGDDTDFAAIPIYFSDGKTSRLKSRSRRAGTS